MKSENNWRIWTWITFFGQIRTILPIPTLGSLRETNRRDVEGRHPCERRFEGGLTEWVIARARMFEAHVHCMNNNSCLHSKVATVVFFSLWRLRSLWWDKTGKWRSRNPHALTADLRMRSDGKSLPSWNEIHGTLNFKGNHHWEGRGEGGWELLRSLGCGIHRGVFAEKDLQ